MNILAEVQRLTGIVETKQQQRNVAEGRLQAALENLQGLGIASLEEGKAYIEKETAEIAAKEEELNADIIEFKEVYAQYLA